MDNALRAALLSILRPLVRYLIGRGWTYPLLTDMLKTVYLEEAVGHYSDDASPEGMTDSRASLLTGLHRKDVKRLRAAMRESAFTPALRRDAGLAARVVAAWVSTPRYLDGRRRPKPLPVTAGAGRLSFETLVRETRADMKANVILEELERVGVAEVGEDGKVRLLRGAYVSELPRDKIAYFGENIADHLQSAIHNIAGQGTPFVERAVYYELIAPDDLERLRPELTRLSEEFLKTINAKVMPLNAEAIRRRDKRGKRMRLGVFYYEDKSRVSAASAGRKHT
jgi:Family of unknown function (DUF6502)